MRRRELSFGLVAVVLMAGYAALGARVLPALSATTGPTPTPPKPVAPVPAPQLPGRIAFVLRGDVFTLSAGSYRPHTADARSIQPSLSADGATLVFARLETIDGARVFDGAGTPANLGFSRIVRKAVGGGPDEVLVDGLRQRSGAGFHLVSWYLSPALSPDARRLALTEDDGDGASDLEIVDISQAGRRPVRILSTGAQLSDPAWSPDGTTLAVTTYNTAVAGILIWPVDGGRSARRLDGLPEGDAYRPSFSPDGAWLTYTLRHDGRNDVHAVELASGRDVTLTSDGHSWNSVFSPDGRYVAFLRAEGQAIDLYAMELGDILSGGPAKQTQKITRGEGVDGASRPSWSR